MLTSDEFHNVGSKCIVDAIYLYYHYAAFDYDYLHAYALSLISE